MKATIENLGGTETVFILVVDDIPFENGAAGKMLDFCAYTDSLAHHSSLTTTTNGQPTSEEDFEAANFDSLRHTFVFDKSDRETVVKALFDTTGLTL